MAVKQFTCYLTYHQIAEVLPTEEQKGAYWVAIMRYMFDGIDTESEQDPLVQMALINAKSHLKTSLRSSSNRTSGNENSIKADGNKINSNENSIENDAEEWKTHQSKVKTKVKAKVKTQTKDDSFPLLCLKALNNELGTTFSLLPPSISNHLETLREVRGLTVEEVAAMVRYKRDEWLGTRWQRHLTPNTLLSVEHIEQYLEQAKGVGDDAESRELADEFDF